jgi:hypothetical protein
VASRGTLEQASRLVVVAPGRLVDIVWIACGKAVDNADTWPVDKLCKTCGKKRIDFAIAE